jgi:predicted CXXCH cytochrome family protein
MIAPPPMHRVRAAVAAAVLALGVLMWLGCGTAQERYRVLSVFFDGVPNPNATTQESGLVALSNPGAGSARPVLLSIHKPYVDKQCQACHETAQGVVSASVLNNDSCVQCHEQVLTQYPKMHEAVTNKACLWCHEPHGSRFTKLLRTDAAALCTQCHDRGLLSTNTPEHQSAEGSCLACHTGHKG